MGRKQPEILKKRKFETTEERSRIMSRVRSRGNKSTEERLAKIFRRRKITGWRRHYKIIGTPDFVFPKSKVAIFVDGCFWHGCKLCYKAPKSNTEFWSAKIAYNRRKDRRVSRQLRAKGWHVIRVWEHSLKEPNRVTSRITSIINKYKKQNPRHKN
jgi:DNA mismatch endonuclease (patch repair protein)